MKKIFLCLLSLLVLCGCSKYNKDSIKKDLNNSMKKVNGYYIVGNLDVYNGDNNYKYKVESSYYKGNYKVDLLNLNNNHEQIILRNNDGVYVLNPSLNKSYKFQSNWPDNNSQIYFIDSLLNDINLDDDFKLVKNKDGYIIECKLAYSNNKNLVNEKIYLDKNLNIKKIEVYDDNKNIQMKFVINSIDKKAVFDNNYFDVSENLKTEETEETMKEIDDTIYPMYLPSGTYLSSEESVNKEDGERVILTFAGETPFIMVQETVNNTKEVMSVTGDPEFITDTIGAIGDNSIEFISNGIEYYISSENMTSNEMMQVAESLSPVAVMK